MSVTISGSDNLVLQVVNANYSTQTTTTAITFSNTGLTASITPKFATSKILVIINQNGVGVSNTSVGVNINLLRGATIISNMASTAYYGPIYAMGSVAFQYLDSPATTSSTTYSTQFSSGTSGQTAYCQQNSNISSITLMEISGS